MGHQTFVYGVIQTLTDRDGKALAANRAVLASLPTADDSPFMVREMFALSESAQVQVQYSYALVHFAASYKQLEDLWTEWIQKFEQVLFRLHGVSAVVHVEGERLPAQRVEWEARYLNPAEGRSDWQHVRGPRTTDEVWG